MADLSNNDNIISKAAAKLYEIPTSEFSSYSVPLDGTWPIDSINFPNAPPPSLVDGQGTTLPSVSKQWWVESIEENDIKHERDACHTASATPIKNIVINEHQVSIETLT